VSEPINDGGPAFPVSTRPCDTDHGYGHQDGPSTYQYGGMSLRDHFAGQALPALILAANRSDDLGLRGDDAPTIDEYAIDAYRIADAMLKAREQQS
jgi:hypothetical protein